MYNKQNLYLQNFYVTKFIRNVVCNFTVQCTYVYVTKFIINPSIAYVQVNGHHVSRFFPVFFQYDCNICEKLKINLDRSKEQCCEIFNQILILL